MGSKVRDWASILEDTELLGRLSAGDMVTQDAITIRSVYQCCKTVLERQSLGGLNYKAKEREVSNIVVVGLVLYIEEARLDEDMAQVFKLANLVELYQSRMQQLGVKLETNVHSTRTQRGETSYWYLKKTSGLFPPNMFLPPVSWTVTMMWSILHVLHRPCAAICLKKVNPLTDSQKDTKKIMCHHCYLPW